MGCISVSNFVFLHRLDLVNPGLLFTVGCISVSNFVFLHRLDLDKWINDPPESSEEEVDDEDIDSMFFENEK